MRGVVVHYEGRVIRCLTGRRNQGRLAVTAVMPVPTAGSVEEPVGTIPSRPLSFAFYVGGQLYATTRRVVITKGRKYPHVEHWFFYPDNLPPAVAANCLTSETVSPA